MRRFKHTPLTLAIGSLLAATAAGSAMAQSEPVVERVEITAQRRIEPLQDVPAAVNALTAKQLEARGVTSTQDFVAAIPNMSFDQSFTHLNRSTTPTRPWPSWWTACRRTTRSSSA